MNPRQSSQPPGGAGMEAGRAESAPGRPPESPDAIGSAKQLLLSGLAHLRTRAELLGIELNIEKTRLLGLVVAGAAAGVLALFVLQLVILLVVAAVWDTPHRMTAIGGMLALFVALCAIAVWLTLQRVNTRSVLFSASAHELRKDEEALA